jgi:uncharacterized membrane protein YphA (DoxX/SURF4 family)
VRRRAWVASLGVNQVQRLFSKFAGGWPALGLCLIRIVLGTSLIIDGKTGLHSGSAFVLSIFSALAIANGILLIAGLWTSYAGYLAIALSLGQILGHYEGHCPPILLAAMGAGVAFVGPGAFSIDAWLFGLKRINIDKVKRPPRS